MDDDNTHNHMATNKFFMSFIPYTYKDQEDLYYRMQYGLLLFSISNSINTITTVNQNSIISLNKPTLSVDSIIVNKQTDANPKGNQVTSPTTVELEKKFCLADRKSNY
jgi:hypothetical protein